MANATRRQTGAKSSLLAQYRGLKELGSVHGKFANGFNVQFPTRLLYVGNCDAPLSAFGITIPSDRMATLLSGLSIGDLVTHKGEKLFIYGRDGVMRLDLAGLEDIDLKFQRYTFDPAMLASSEVFSLLEDMKLSDATGLDRNQETHRQLTKLWQSDKEDFAENYRLVSYLAGRGVGLTPSGDDILLGFTFALMLFGKFVHWERAISIGINKETTTAISMAYLTALLSGYVSEPLLQFSALMNCNGSGLVREKTLAVAAFGHTSGVDVLFGFYMGLKFLLNNA